MRAGPAVRLGGALVALAAGCAGAGPRRLDAGASTPPAGLRTPGMRAPDDPTVADPRVLPATFDEARPWGPEPGGGVRAIVAGLRVVVRATGQLEAARDPLPGNPQIVTELPDRLGGGFLFAMGARGTSHLWRAPTWLGPASPILTTGAPLADVFVGLDRVYVRVAQGPLAALDPRTGAPLDLGPLPASPRVATVAALDAWRAVAVADLRGAMVTLDAGSSWRAVPLPVEPSRAVVGAGPEEGFAIAGFDRRRALQWWQVPPEGPPIALASPPGGGAPGPARIEAGEPPLGGRPLLAAIEEGWPLADGSALVARDGFLVRVRLSDGAVVEKVDGAYPMKPSRCHPISLAREGDRGAFGFACGAPRAGTMLFAWDAASSRLAELRAWDAPREVLAAGNGALAVRGACATDATSGKAGEQAWCWMAPDRRWREVRFTGAGVDRARVVALADGRVALVRPPEGGDLSTARLTITDGFRASDVPLHVPPVEAGVARVLREGIWMDGFEERRPGVLGGWIDAAGPLLGVEISLEGELRAGEYIRDAGAPVASGRWALGWTDSGGGFETTDGGMSWTKGIALPDPIAEPRIGRERACGPIGCVMAGWLRLGWGPVEPRTALVETPVKTLQPPPSRPSPARRALGLLLDCARLPSPPRVADVPSSAFSTAPAAVPFVTSSAYGRRGDPSGPTVSQFGLFAGRPGPAMAPGEMGASVGASLPFERSLTYRFMARAYAWGPTARDWDPPGHFMVRWLWPWWGPADGPPLPRTSSLAPAPWSGLSAAARAMGSSVGTLPEWTVIPGDDANHALLAERRSALVSTVQSSPGDVTVVALETDRLPVDVRREGGALLPDLQGAVRSGGRWYVSTTQPPGEVAATVLWVLDGGIAREVGRVPRVAPESAGPARVVRWVGGGASAVALAVPGQDPDGVAPLYVARFDPEGHVFADPEKLDAGDHPITACVEGDAGWELVGSFPGSVDIRARDGWSARLRGAMARLRVWRAGACVDRVFASADLPAVDATASHQVDATASHQVDATASHQVDATASHQVDAASHQIQMSGRGLALTPVQGNGPGGPTANVAVTVVASAPTAITSDPDRERFQCRLGAP